MCWAEAVADGRADVLKLVSDGQILVDGSDLIIDSVWSRSMSCCYVQSWAGGGSLSMASRLISAAFTTSSGVISTSGFFKEWLFFVC